MKVVTLKEVLESTTPVLFAPRVEEEGESGISTGLGYLLQYTGEYNIEEDWFKALPITGDLYWLNHDSDKVNIFVDGAAKDLPLAPKVEKFSIKCWSACSFIVFAEEDVKTFIGNLARTFHAITKLQVTLNDGN